MQIYGWGKYPVIEGEEYTHSYAHNIVNECRKTNWIPRGMARSYGDSALASKTISSLKLNRFLAFEEETGILSCESGVTFEDILTYFVPKGWFPPVTPGTKFVTMGGAIASDVHGKNHHKEGSFSNHTHSFILCTAKGEILNCSRSENVPVFWATLGGMGLTGMVLTVTFQLKKIETSWIKMESVKTRNLAETLAILNENEDATYTMAWTDCMKKGDSMGRSVFMKGEHASLYEISDTKIYEQSLALPNKLKLTVPFDFPSFALNSFSVKAFNFLYYNKQFPKKKEVIADYDSFFYPLDAIHHWNRIYGKRGFTQYQFVIPKEKGYEGMKRIIEKIGAARMGSFLVVLKAFGPQNSEYLAFPQAGYTLAMDFAIEPRLFPFLEELDKIVLEYGGRVYLTKDARLSPETFRIMYPTLPRFQAIIQGLDPERKIRSVQSDRLGI
jgi:decaprenylphospho-beta-D-ribofuranose 2-oxidase